MATLAISDEYDDGQIRTSLVATPSRPRFLAAKMIIAAVDAVLIGLVAFAFTIITRASPPHSWS